MLFGKHINRYYLRHLPRLLLGIVALVAVDIMQLKIPELYAMVINGMDQGTVTFGGATVPFDLTFLLDHICMDMVWIILAMVSGRFLWRICFIGTAIRTETDLRERMFDRCRRLSQNFYRHSKIGDLMSLFTNDLDTIQECFAWGVLMFFDAAFLGGLAIFKMYRMDRGLTLLCLIPMSFLLVASALLGRYMQKKWDIRQAAFSRLSDFTQERFSGLAVIKAFVKEAHELMSFRKLNEENEKANMDHTQASVLMRILVMLFVESVICVILGYGGTLVHRGTFNAGQLMEFMGYFSAVIWPIMAVSELIDMTSRGKASLDRIGHLLDQVPDITDRPTVRDIPIRGQIAADHLTFRYPDADCDALTDLSFTIGAGEHVGIIGRTGSGKSTLADLLMRMNEAPEGSLSIDGTDVTHLPLQTLRKAVAFVPQDDFLFSDTIARNIAFSHVDAPMDRIRDAAKLAQVHDNISGFDRGYETVLGERGVTVSGGQKQRISIARALITEAPILVMDDSVSAVDTATERQILQALRTSRPDKTTILISHRVSSIRELDKLLFLEDGRLTAVGTHAELYEHCPSYRRMVDLQKLDEEGADLNG